MFGNRVTSVQTAGLRGQDRLELDHPGDPDHVVAGKGVFPAYFEDMSASNYWAMGVAGALGLFLSIIFPRAQPLADGQSLRDPHEGDHPFHLRRRGRDERRASQRKGRIPHGHRRSRFQRAHCGRLLRHPADWGDVRLAPGHQRRAFLPCLGECRSWPCSICCRPFRWTGAGCCGPSSGAGRRIFTGRRWSPPGSARPSGYCSSRWGLWEVIEGNFIGGLWQAMIGLFLRGAAKSSYQQIVTRDLLVRSHGGPLHDLRSRDRAARHHPSGLRG